MQGKAIARPLFNVSGSNPLRPRRDLNTVVRHLAPMYWPRGANSMALELETLGIGETLPFQRTCSMVEWVYITRVA